MSVKNIWTSGGPGSEEAALERARALGYRDPVVARMVVSPGVRSSTLVGMIVAEGAAEAEEHRQARKRGGRNGNGG